MICASIAIDNDQSFEKPESFSVQISTLEENVAIEDNDATVNIIDDDGMYVGHEDVCVCV